MEVFCDWGKSGLVWIGELWGRKGGMEGGRKKERGILYKMCKRPGVKEGFVNIEFASIANWG